MQKAFRTDVRSIVAEARRRSGAAIDPLGTYRRLKVRETLVNERGASNKATGL
jgi:L-rhamnose isomerase/sugar isomerase